MAKLAVVALYEQTDRALKSARSDRALGMGLSPFWEIRRGFTILKQATQNPGAGNPRGAPIPMPVTVLS